MKKIEFFISIVIMPLLSTGCSFDTGGGFLDSREEVMIEIKLALEQENIPFDVTDDGMIHYTSKYKDKINAIRERVEKELNGGISQRYDDEIIYNSLTEELNSRNMKFRIENRDDGEWIRWYPESKSQEEEIQMIVMQRYFDVKAKELGAECEQQQGELNLPSNQSLNEDASQAGTC